MDSGNNNPNQPNKLPALSNTSIQSLGNQVRLLDDLLQESNPEYWFQKAVAQKNLEDWNSSLYFLNKSLFISPKHHSSLSLKCLVLANLNKAVDCYDALLFYFNNVCVFYTKAFNSITPYIPDSKNLAVGEWQFISSFWLGSESNITTDKYLPVAISNICLGNFDIALNYIELLNSENRNTNSLLVEAIAVNASIYSNAGDYTLDSFYEALEEGFNAAEKILDTISEANSQTHFLKANLYSGRYNDTAMFHYAKAFFLEKDVVNKQLIATQLFICLTTAYKLYYENFPQNPFDEKWQHYELAKSIFFLVKEFSKKDIDTYRLFTDYFDKLMASYYTLLGVMNGKSPKLSDAVNCYNKAIEICPLYAKPYQYRGALFDKIGRSEDSKKDWDTYKSLMDTYDRGHHEKRYLIY